MPTPPNLNTFAFCFTGFRDDKMATEIARLGGVYCASFTYSSNVLVVRSYGFESEKTRKAKARGLIIISSSDLRDAIRDYEAFKKIVKDHMKKSSRSAYYATNVEPIEAVSKTSQEYDPTPATRKSTVKAKPEDVNKFAPPKRKITFDDE